MISSLESNQQIINQIQKTQDFYKMKVQKSTPSGHSLLKVSQRFNYFKEKLIYEIESWF